MLEAFEGLLWLQAAVQVERCYGITEATTSRYRKRCLQLFGLAMERRHGEWELIGDTSLLLRERHVHQEARWRGYLSRVNPLGRLASIKLAGEGN